MDKLSFHAIAGHWRTALAEAARLWRPLVLFQVWYALIVGALLSSAAGWLLDHLVRTTGSAAVTNFDLAGFFLSPLGLAFVVLLVGIGGASFFAERCGVLLLVADPATPMGAVGALRQSLLHAPQLAWLGWLYAIMFAAALVPFALVAVLIAWLLIGAHDINYYLYHQPREWWLAVVCGGVLLAGYACVALYLWFRFVFAVQLVLFERLSPRAALARSWSMTKGKVWSVAVLQGGWWLVVSLIFTAGSALAGVLAAVALGFAGTHVGTALPIMLGGAIAIWLIGVAGHIVSMAGDAILARRLYRSYGGKAPSESAAGSPKLKRHAYLAWTITAAIGVVFLAVAAVNAWQIESNDQFTITAHRAGAAKAPENTLAALNQAIADGADFAEIDVQTTRDGELVILHDGDLARLAGDPRRVADLTLSELRQLDIGRWHDATFAGERVATLGEMIALARGRIRLNVELKYNRSDPSLAPKVIQLLRSEGVLDQCIITSLEQSAVRDAKRLAPEVQVGLIVTKSIGDPANADADFLSLNQKAVSARLLHRAHSRGKEVHVWTVNDRPSMERMVEMGVDSLITDHPAIAAELRKARADLTAHERLVLRLRTALLGQ